jgi:hypothetical protein
MEAYEEASRVFHPKALVQVLIICQDVIRSGKMQE